MLSIAGPGHRLDGRDRGGSGPTGRVGEGEVASRLSYVSPLA
jgi:hypothetical protein